MRQTGFGKAGERGVSRILRHPATIRTASLGNAGSCSVSTRYSACCARSIARREFGSFGPRRDKIKNIIKVRAIMCPKICDDRRLFRAAIATKDSDHEMSRLLGRKGVSAADPNFYRSATPMPDAGADALPPLLPSLPRFAIVDTGTTHQAAAEAAALEIVERITRRIARSIAAAHGVDVAARGRTTFVARLKMY